MSPTLNHFWPYLAYKKISWWYLKWFDSYMHWQTHQPTTGHSWIHTMSLCYRYTAGNKHVCKRMCVVGQLLLGALHFTSSAITVTFGNSLFNEANMQCWTRRSASVWTSLMPCNQHITPACKNWLTCNYSGCGVLIFLLRIKIFCSMKYHMFSWCGENINVVYLDFVKVFDKMPNCRLIRKLEAHGTGENIVSWITNGYSYSYFI